MEILPTNQQGNKREDGSIMETAESTLGGKSLHLLIVEDDENLAHTMGDDFGNRRITSEHANTLAQARKLLDCGHRYDAIVLDLNLPDGNGVELARDCRRNGYSVPIIVVTAMDAVEDRVIGLRHGADDYLCKPFSLEELAARIEAICRRNRHQHGHILAYKDIRVDLLKRTVSRGDIEVQLSTRELDLLAYFMANAEVVLEKKKIQKEVWGDNGEGDDNLLQVYANYLRNKLEGGRFPRVIHTVRGVGYVLSETPPQQ